MHEKGPLKLYFFSVFDLFKAFASIENSRKSDSFFFFKKTNFLHARATCSELPSNRSTMLCTVDSLKNLHAVILNVKVFSIHIAINRTRLNDGPT